MVKVELTKQEAELIKKVLLSIWNEKKLTKDEATEIEELLKKVEMNLK